MKKQDKKETFKPLEEITFSGESIFYDAAAEQTIPFPVTQKTAGGFFDTWLAHRFAPVSDKQFLDYVRKNDEEVAQSNQTDAPGFELWDNIAIERIGYVPKDDWKEKTPTTHKIQALKNLLKCEPVVEMKTDVLESEFLFDDEENCLRFNVPFGGVPLETWRGWLTGGIMPANLSEWFDENEYEKAVRMLNKNIAPAVMIEVRHYFNQASEEQKNEYSLIGQNKPRKGVLATAAKANRETKTERLIGLYEGVRVRHEGYKGEPPAFHKFTIADQFLSWTYIDLGKFSA